MDGQRDQEAATKACTPGAQTWAGWGMQQGEPS